MRLNVSTQNNASSAAKPFGLSGDWTDDRSDLDLTDEMQLSEMNG
jgi:hypothetical protein